MNQVRIQINSNLNLNKTNGKPSRNDVATYNYLNYWETKSLSVDELIESHLSGDTFRYGLKFETNDQVNFCSGFALDLDLEGSNVAATLEHPFTQNAYLGYYSPSMDVEPDRTEFSKHRLCFLFEYELQDLETIEYIVKYYIHSYGYALDSGFDPGRLWFSTKLPPFYRNPSARINIAEVMNLADNDESFQSQYNSSYVYEDFKSPEGTTLEVYQFLLQNLPFDQPWNHLFHHVPINEFKKRRNDKVKSTGQNIIEKYDCPTPEEYRVSSSGTGFCVSLIDDGLIVFWDREDPSVSGTLFDYIYWSSNNYNLSHIRIPKGDHKTWWTTVRSTMESLGLLDLFCKQFPQTTSSDIAASFFVTDSKGNKKLNANCIWTAFAEAYDNRFSYSKADGMFHFYTDENYWIELDHISMFHKIKDFIALHIGERNKNLYLTASLGESIKKLLLNNVKGSNAEPLHHDCNYVPFKNGCFNLKTKQLEEYSPSIKNTFIRSFDYVPSQNIGIEYLRELLTKLIKINGDQTEQDKLEAVEDIIKYICVTVQFRGGELGVALGIYGTPNSGKTDIGELIVNMMYERKEGIRTTPAPYLKMQANMLFSDNQFIRKSLLGVKFLWLEEFSGFSIQQQSLFKDYIDGKKNAEITTDVKNKNVISFLANFSALTTSQSIPRQKDHEDKGLLRRFFWIEFDVIKKTTNLFDLVKEYTPDILSWMIEQDIEDYIKELKKKAFVDKKDDDDNENDDNNNENDKRENWVSKNRMIVKSHNNVIYRFIDECVIFNENYRTPGKIVYDFYKQWRHTDHTVNQTKFGREFKKALMEIHNIEDERKLFIKTGGIINYRVKCVEDKDLEAIKDEIETV